MDFRVQIQTYVFIFIIIYPFSELVSAEVTISSKINKHPAPVIPNYPTDLFTFSDVSREDTVMRDFSKTATVVNMFERFVSPMLMLQTIFSSITSDDPFHRTLLPIDDNILDLIHLVVKCGKYNKWALRSTKTETVHQTVHSNPVLMGIYETIVKKTSQLNQKLTDLQLDVNLQLYPFHGIQAFSVRLVHTVEKLIPRSEAESLSEHLTNTFKKRTATINRSSSFKRNNNDEGPRRKKRRF